MSQEPIWIRRGYSSEEERDRFARAVEERDWETIRERAEAIAERMEWGQLGMYFADIYEQLGIADLPKDDRGAAVDELRRLAFGYPSVAS